MILKLDDSKYYNASLKEFKKFHKKLDKKVAFFHIDFKKFQYNKDNGQLIIFFEDRHTKIKKIKVGMKKNFLGFPWLTLYFDFYVNRAYMIINHVISYTIEPDYLKQGFGFFMGVTINNNSVEFFPFDDDDKPYLFKVEISEVDIEVNDMERLYLNEKEYETYYENNTKENKK